jgi:MSHA biogenesis protein MshP
MRRAQQGFLIMAAIFLLVVCSAYIAYLSSQSSVSQSTGLLDVQSARAYQTARAGIEWGAFQLLRNGATCAAFPTTLTFAGTTLSDFSAVVTCSQSGAINEGAAAAVVVYQLTSTGCNAGSCPSASAASTYAERQLSVTIAK